MNLSPGALLAAELTAGAGGVLLSCKGDLVQHELGDGVRELGGHGEQRRFGLETILVGHELHFHHGAVRSSVPVGAFQRHNHKASSNYLVLIKSSLFSHYRYCKLYLPSSSWMRSYFRMGASFSLEEESYVGAARATEARRAMITCGETPVVLEKFPFSVKPHRVTLCLYGIHGTLRCKISQGTRASNQQYTIR
ncbi:hypothetical protein E2C01_022308 [Portunus trituberculatus]|uniref:Uncharacterized protein n=1 Tax=Portunus trituberculatus TaxID=210409 RepID=A0A5B7E511_PORTR|nr:hypothetical protein [Portunus trituberculatus]